MDISDGSYYINKPKNNKNKGSQMGHTEKKRISNEVFTYYSRAFILIIEETLFLVWKKIVKSIHKHRIAGSYFV
jgi:hypothetical protein